MAAAQQQRFWYFGVKAGLDFFPVTQPQNPMAIGDSSMATSEGCSVYSGKYTGLHCYTDGSTVWNKNHEVMLNGTDLKGNSSSTQSSLLLLKPGTNNTLCLFTAPVNNSSDSQIYYNEIDLLANNQNGEVTIKNVQVGDPAVEHAEKIAATKHANEVDYWVVFKEKNTPTYHVLLLTNAGYTNHTSFVSPGYRDPSLPESATATGYLCFSPNGQQLASCLWSHDAIELFNFNTSTGTISYVTTLLPPADQSLCYGACFSPDSTKLYTTFIKTSASGLYSWNTSTATSLISTTLTDVGSLEMPGAQSYDGGALQIGPDDNIYVALHQTPYLSVITNPNQVGGPAVYSLSSINLEVVPGDERTSRLGLPQTVTDNTKLDSECVSLVFPDVLYPNQTVSASVTVKNTSNMVWTSGELFRLGCQDPQDNNNWNICRIELPSGTPVPVGDNVTFTFQVTAPATAGTHVFSWQMLSEAAPGGLSAWFGQKCSKEITIERLPCNSDEKVSIDLIDSAECLKNSLAKINKNFNTIESLLISLSTCCSLLPCMDCGSPDYTPPEPTSTPPPPVDTNCNVPLEYSSGGISYPVVFPFELGPSTGSVTLTFNALSRPDRFICSIDGAVLLDTGYYGAEQYAFGQWNRSAFTNRLSGLTDPITGNVYPFPHITHEADNYPKINAPGFSSLSFVKTSTTSTCLVSAFAPMIATLWEINLGCPT